MSSETSSENFPKVFRCPSHERCVYREFVFLNVYLYVYSLYLTFVLSFSGFRLVGMSMKIGAKESGREEVYATKSLSSREPPDDSETATPQDTSVLDIALVSRRTRVINHDSVCGMLTECLQDVSSLCSRCLIYLLIAGSLLFIVFVLRLPYRLRLPKLSSLRIEERRSTSIWLSLKRRKARCNVL
jgi:hypothetical protein